MRSGISPVIVGLTLMGLTLAAPGADNPVDPGLLEYLGSVDSEDRDWNDYLAHTDIDRVARRAGPPRAAPPASANPPVSPAPGSVPPASPAPPTGSRAPTDNASPNQPPAPVTQR